MNPFKAKPRKHETYKAKRYTPKPIQSQTLPIGSNCSSSVSEEEKSSNATLAPQELSGRSIKVVIEKDNREEKKSYWPNIIGWITAGISAFAVFVAIDANQKTQQALTHQIEKDSLDDITDSIKHWEDSLNYRKQFVLDSTSTQAQIDAFRNERKVSELENETEISISNITLFINSLQKSEISYSLNNVGRVPAKILKVEEGTLVQPYPLDAVKNRIEIIKSFKEFTLTRPLNKNITNSSPLSLSIHPTRITTDLIDSLKEGEAFLYFGLKAIYQNKYDKSFNTYECMYEIIGLNVRQTKLIYEADRKF